MTTSVLFLFSFFFFYGCWRHADDEVDRFVLSEEGAVAAPATGQAKKGAQPTMDMHSATNDVEHGLTILATQSDGEETKRESEPLPLAVVGQPEAAEDCDDSKGAETNGKGKEEKETVKNERQDEAGTVKKERRRQSQPSQVLHEPQPSRKKSRARSSAPNPARFRGT